MTTEFSATNRIHEVDVDAVASAVLDCSSVMGLGAEIATYRAGRRIAGVHIRGDVVRLHVLGRYDMTVEAVCAEITAAVMPLAPGKDIDIDIVEMVEAYPFAASDEPAAAPRQGQQANQGSHGRIRRYGHELEEL